MSTTPESALRELYAEVLPPAIVPLITDRFVESTHLLEEYVGRLALEILRQLGAEEALAEPASAAELADRLELDAEAATVPLAWLLDLSAGRGHLERLPGDRFALESALPRLDPEEIRARQEAHDAAALPSYDIAAFAAESYPACLRGEISGERALFAPQRLTHWSRYFDNGNPLYSINNRIPALTAAAAGPFASILELGSGLGSGGEALLEALEAAGRLGALERYRLTDISPVFLRRGQRRLEAEAPDVPLEAGRLDIDRPFEDQGVAAGSFELIFAVNTVHVARDLAATLGQIHQSLAPGGLLVLGEGIRPFAGRAVYSELVFLLLESFRSPTLHPDYRPTGGFLTPENWRAALEAAGFVDVEIAPDIARVREEIPAFLTASVAARHPG